jgi:molybdate transport system substrate-binding protein
MKVRITSMAIGLMIIASACGSDAPSTSPPRFLRVVAASSLTEAFTAIGDDYEESHPDVKVGFTFGASSTLAEQIVSGSHVDVFASADAKTMARVNDAGWVAGKPVAFARNRLALVVGKGNPKHISGLPDLGREGVVFVMCAREVPCGRYGAALLARAGVSARPASLEENVKGVVAKVALGEADAGLVYETDVKAAAGRADGVSIDIASDPALLASYPIAAIGEGGEASADARAFVTYMRSDEGQRVLRSYGFLGP